MRVFTDGACSGNPGPGGWAWVTDDGRQGSGGETDTTNQRMELTAVLRALETLRDGPLEVNSDSTYVVNCFKDRWYEGWLAKDWKNSQRKPVANRDLWEPLVELVLARGDELTFRWVKGHSGHEMNDLADRLAVEALNRHRDGLAARSGGGEGDGTADGPPGPVPPWPMERAIVVIGVRELGPEQVEELAEVISGLDRDNDVVVSGLRLGAELTGAELARNAGVPLGVVLPFADPAAGWSRPDRERFETQVAAADWVITLDGDRARPGPSIKARNSWMFDATVGAIVVGDEGLADEAENAGLGVISL